MKITLQPFRLLLAVTTLAVALLFTVAFTTTVSAKDKGGKKDNDTPDTRVLVQSVDSASQTVVLQTMADKSTHSYQINSGTVITVNDNPGTFADIKPGMQVNASTEADSSTLASISVGIASPAPEGATPKKAKKGSMGSASSGSSGN